MLRQPSDPVTVVIGIFSYASDARRALNTLREHDFSADQVAAAFREPASAREVNPAPLAARSSGQWFGQLRQLYHEPNRVQDRMPPVIEEREGSTTGITPARLSDFQTMLAQLDLSPQDARILDRDLNRGGAIVTVKAGARNPEAQQLLEQRGAHIVHGRHAAPVPLPSSESLPASTQPVAVTSTPFSPPQQADPGHIQLFGEVLRVRKEKVSSGDVHVRKESVTHMETVQVPVTREHLVVDHSDGSDPTSSGDSIRIPLSEERVHIDKDTVLREEYKVGKREVTQNEAVSDTVRRERLLIDDARARDKGE